MANCSSAALWSNLNGSIPVSGSLQAPPKLRKNSQRDRNARAAEARVHRKGRAFRHEANAELLMRVRAVLRLLSCRLRVRTGTSSAVLVVRVAAAVLPVWTQIAPFEVAVSVEKFENSKKIPIFGLKNSLPQNTTLKGCKNNSIEGI